MFLRHRLTEYEMSRYFIGRGMIKNRQTIILKGRHVFVVSLHTPTHVIQANSNSIP